VDFGEHERQAADSSFGASTPLGELEELSPPRSRHPRFWAGAVVLVVVVTAAAALTLTGTPYKSAVVVLSEAAARTTGSGTARSSTVESLTIDGVTNKPLDVEASEDFGHKSARLTLFDGHGNAIETARTIAGVTYVSIPGAPDRLPGGAHWVSITPADMKLDPSVASLGSSDPSSGLQFLSAIAGSPRIVDHDPLDLVTVTHYAFTLDLQSLFDRLGKGVNALGVPAIGAALEQLKSLVDLTKVPGEAWIDTDGRVRRFTMTLNVAEAGRMLNVVSDTRFSHFDEPVTVPAPPASDTVPFRQVPHFFSDLVRPAAPTA